MSGDFTPQTPELQFGHRQMSTPQPSDDGVEAMLIDGEDEQEQLQQPDRLTPTPESSPSPSSSHVDLGEEEAKRKRALETTVNTAERLFCPICMEPWSSEGDHQVSCLPCGHVYGMSCITKWTQRRGGESAKCPQCNTVYRLKDVIKLYASPIVLLDESLQKKVKSLEAQIISLQTERDSLLDIQDELFNVQENVFKNLSNLKEKPSSGDDAAFGEKGLEPLYLTDKDNLGQGRQWDHYFAHTFGRQILRCKFLLEYELAVEGARLFDMDASFQTLVLAQRISGMGGTHKLKKVNLNSPLENEDIQLPPGTKAIKDLRVSPCSRLTLLASLGKKLSILSMGSNSIVSNYDLPIIIHLADYMKLEWIHKLGLLIVIIHVDQAWSCSWDLNSPHYAYAGLQNGMLLMFDMRHSRTPLQSLVGLTTRPIYTIHSLVQNRDFNYATQRLLTASSSGPCAWNIGSPRERPFLIPGSLDQGVCISVAYSPATDDIVASYRPKTETSSGTVGSNDSASSHRPKTETSTGSVGSQVLIKRVAGCLYHKIGSVPLQLNDFHLTKSAIVDIPNCYPLFAYGEEVTHGLSLRELPSLKVSQNLHPHQHSILDVKYARSQGKGLLGCLSEDKLQLFSATV